MKKITLHLEEEHDFSLFGIATHEKDYKLCWRINNHLRSDFKRVNDIQLIDNKTKTDNFYAVYEHIEEDDFISFYIIANKKENHLLVPEIKFADFLFLIKGPYASDKADWLSKEIKQIKIIDNGKGIPRENLVKIFNYGFTTKEHGHGFGLHSAANALTEMGSSITAKSDGAGKGATFIISF